jgi:hypothetical protein
MGEALVKAIKIDRTGAVELVEGTWDQIWDKNVTVDAVSIAERTHSIYFDDFGLFGINAVVAKIGIYPNVPLPALVVGSRGEHDVDVTLTVDEVAAMVTDVRPVR